MDVSQVRVLLQLRDSVCLAQTPRSDGEKEVVILKALTSFSRYIDHELKVLLTMPPHPYIIGKSLQLVTKKMRL